MSIELRDHVSSSFAGNESWQVVRVGTNNDTVIGRLTHANGTFSFLPNGETLKVAEMAAIAARCDAMLRGEMQAMRDRSGG